MNNGAAFTKPQFHQRPQKVWPWLLVVGAIIVVAGVISQFRTQTYTFNGLQFDPVELAFDFTLIDQNLQPVSLSDFRGRVTLLYFGFLNCPDECPLTIATWKQTAGLLGDKADQVRFVMITVDPARDTPEKMGEYLSLFNPDFIGLSGSLEDIEDIALPYSVYFKKLEIEEEAVKSAHLKDSEHGHNEGEGHGHEEEHYLVAHTTLTFVIDQAGQLVLAFPLGTEADKIAADLRHLIQ